MSQKKYAINYPVLLACFSLFACERGSNGNGTANPLHSISADESIFLTRTVAAPEGERCARGGFQVESGEDRNKDGELEDGEVVRKDVVCNDTSILPNYYTMPFSKSPEAFANATITCDPLFIQKNYKHFYVIGDARFCRNIKISGFPFLARGLAGRDICRTFGFQLPIYVISTDVSRGDARKFYEWDSSRREWMFVDIPEGENREDLFSIHSVGCLIPDRS